MSHYQMSGKLKIILGLMLFIIIGTALLVPLASSINPAVYNLSSTQTVAVASGTSKTISLFGQIWNDTSHITVHLTNVTGTYTLGTAAGAYFTAKYLVTVVGTTAPTNATMSVTGLVSAASNVLTITYNYANNAVMATLLPLIPLFIVIMILLAVIFTVYVLIKFD